VKYRFAPTEITSNQVLEYGRENKKPNVYLDYFSQASKRLLLGLPGVIGLICWVLACRIFKEAGSISSTSGVGPSTVTTPTAAARSSTTLPLARLLRPRTHRPFPLGITPSLYRRGMALPWIIWSLIFRRSFRHVLAPQIRTLGLMRIMASTSPVTALICLEAGLWCEQKFRQRQMIQAE